MITYIIIIKKDEEIVMIKEEVFDGKMAFGKDLDTAKDFVNNNFPDKSLPLFYDNQFFQTEPTI